MERKAAVDANRVFCITIVLSMIWLYLPGFNQITDMFVLQVLTQLFLVLPSVVYVVMSRKKLSVAVGLKPISPGDVVLLIILALLFNPIVTFLNDISMLFVVNTTSSHMVELMTDKPLVVSVLLIGVLPAVCEEFAYRGVLYQAYRKHGVLKAILLSSFLFGIMHMNLNQFFYAFLLGILFAIVNEAIGSILPSVLIHFLNNATSTIGMFAALRTLTGLREEYVAAEQAGDTALLAEIQAYAGDVPIASENWLEEYMSMEPYTLSEIIQYDLVPALICGILAFFVIRLLAKKHNREEHLKRIFTGYRMKNNEKKQYEITAEKQHITSIALIIGIALCVVNMVLYEVLIRGLL